MYELSDDESVQVNITIEQRPGLLHETWGACDQCCTCGCLVIAVLVVISLVTSLAIVLVGCGVA